MKYYRCKCGKTTAYGSMEPYLCQGCKECGTTLNQHPAGHRKSEPHDFIAVKVETDDGPRTLSRCRWCGQTKAQVEQEGANMHFTLDYVRYDVKGPICAAAVRAKLTAERSGYTLHFCNGQSISSAIPDSELIPDGAVIVAVPHASV